MIPTFTHRVLLADDEQMARSVFRSILQELHPAREASDDGTPRIRFEVDTVSQAHQAVEAVQQALQEQNPYAVVFLDVRMPPGQDGIWAAEHIRALDPEAELVILTAFSDVDLPEVIRRVPPAEKLLFMMKPIHPHELLQTSLSLSQRWFAARLLREADESLRQQRNELQHQLQEEMEQQRVVSKRLDDSRRNYRILFEQLSDAVLVLSRQGHIHSVNQQASRMFGWQEHPVVPENIAQLQDANEAQSFLAHLEKLGPNAPSMVETRLLTTAGDMLEVEASLGLIVEDDTERVLAVLRDITHRKRIEQTMLRHAMVFSAMEEAVIISDNQGHTLDVNPAFRRIYGYSREEVLGKRLDMLNPPDTVDSQQILDEVAQKGSCDRQLPIIRKDGSTGWTYTRVKAMLGENNELLGHIGINTDITEFKRMLDDLRQSEERYRVFVQNFQGIAYRGDLEFGPIFVHGAVEQITGYTPQQLQHNMRWDKLILPEDLDKILQREYEVRNVPGFKGINEYRIRRRDGSIRWVREYIQNASVNGVPQYVQGTVYDITALREAEEARLRAEQLAERSRRLSSLGTLAGGIAHEINQPLTAMKTGVDGLLMLQEMNYEVTPEQVTQTLQSLSRSIRRIEGIIQHMRMLMRSPEQQAMVRLPLDRAAEQALSLFGQKMAAHGISLHREFAPNLPAVRVHAVGLEQALANLVGNAIDALDTVNRADKRVVVRTGQAGDDVFVEVEDNGPGVAEELRNVLFDPFVSTKEFSQGLGLGLSIVENLVSGMSGSITHNPAAGGGSVFRIALPACKTEKPHEDIAGR